MNRFSELAGMVAGLAIVLGTLIAAQSFLSHAAPDLRAGLQEPMN